MQSPLMWAARRSELISNAYQDSANWIERKGRESPRAQRILISVRERLAGFTSERSWNELYYCAQAVARYKHGHAALNETVVNPKGIFARGHAEELLAAFSDKEWAEIENQADRFYLVHPDGY